MADDAKPFELVDDDDEPRRKPAKPAAERTTPDGGEREPAAEALPPLELEPDLEVPPELDPKPEPVADPGPYPSEAAAGAGDDAHAAGAVEELALEAAEADAPAEPAPAFEDEGPSDGSTVRMSLADVVHAWDEDAPADAAHAAAGPVLQEQGPGRRIAIMVLVIVVVLAVIIVLFAACAPAAHAAGQGAVACEARDHPGEEPAGRATTP